MKLKPEDAGLFYELFLPLLDYVNERFHVTVKKVKFKGESIDPRDAIEAAHFCGREPGSLMIIWVNRNYHVNTEKSFVDGSAAFPKLLS